jgi:hypothetical protein
VAGFGNLAEIVFGKDDGVFLLCSVQRRVAHVQQIGTKRQMRSVLLEDSERQQACALCAMNAFAEVAGGELFPVNDGDELACAETKQTVSVRQASNNIAEKVSSRLCVVISKNSFGGKF